MSLPVIVGRSTSTRSGARPSRSPTSSNTLFVAIESGTTARTTGAGSAYSPLLRPSGAGRPASVRSNFDVPFTERVSRAGTRPRSPNEPRGLRGVVRPIQLALRRAIVVLRWVRNIAAIAVLFVAWQLWGTSLGEHQAQTHLAGEFSSSVQRSGAPVIPAPGRPAYRVAPLERGAPSSLPAEGSLVALLQIPSIGLDQYVVQGTTEADLGSGPGHYLGTAFPGYPGNVAIVGHRTTYGAPFNRLGSLRRGAAIYLTTLSGVRYTYLVKSPPVAVAPTDVAVLANFGDNRVTLTTCTPEFSAAQRLIVTAVLRLSKATSEPGGETKSRPAPPARSGASLAGSNGTRRTIGSLVEVLGISGLLVAFGLEASRPLRRYGRLRLILGALPLWGVALFFLLGGLSNVLPPSL